MRINAILGFLGGFAARGRRFDPRCRRFDLGFPAILGFLEVLPPEAGASIPEACASISGFPDSALSPLPAASGQRLPAGLLIIEACEALRFRLHEACTLL